MYRFQKSTVIENDSKLFGFMKRLAKSLVEEHNSAENWKTRQKASWLGSGYFSLTLWYHDADTLNPQQSNATRSILQTISYDQSVGVFSKPKMGWEFTDLLRMPLVEAKITSRGVLAIKLQLLTASNVDTDLNKDQNVTLLCSRQITDQMISISVTFTIYYSPVCPWRLW